MEKKFVEREWNENIEGELDEDGFFTTPNGSFWDPDYVYFNREGYDKHGGYYDENDYYIPGEGWDEIKGCYQDEESDDDFDEEDVPDDKEKGNQNDVDIINKENEKEKVIEEIKAQEDENVEGDEELSDDEKKGYNLEGIEIIKVYQNNNNNNNNKNKGHYNKNQQKEKKYVVYNDFSGFPNKDEKDKEKEKEKEQTSNENNSNK